MRKITFLHGLARAATAPDFRFFTSNARRFREVQAELLESTLAKNEGSAFGREHGFKNMHTYREFASGVPIRDFEAFGPYLARISGRRVDTLTSEATLLFEPTSGSSGAVKLIPYTAGLRRQFSKAINAWLYDLYANYPGIRRGRHFWSITPHAKAPRGDGEGQAGKGIRSGFDDDSSYLGVAGWALKRLFVLPNGMKELDSMEDYYAAAVVFLLAAADMSLVSVWNPSAFELLLRKIPERADIAIRALHDGALNLPSGARVPFRVPKDPERAHLAASLIDRFNRDGDFAGLYGGLWTGLSLISAWGDAESERDFARLRLLFPSVGFQAKGLLATEGVMSFPLTAAGGAVAAYTSHFMEFFPAGSGIAAGVREEGLLLHELREGEDYSVVLTTAGGLYRYLIGDIVCVKGLFRGIPLLRFVSRSSVCDLTGEKLHQDFARQALRVSLAALGLDPTFVLLSPERRERPPRYVLCIEDRRLEPGDGKARELAENLEARLSASFQYSQSRSMGQLAGLRVFVVESGGREAYLGRLVEEGMRLGDIKAELLDKREGWPLVFRGRYQKDA